MAIINLAIQENLPNDLALVAGKMEGQLQVILTGGFACSDVEDLRMARGTGFNPGEVSVLPLLMSSVKFGLEYGPRLPLCPFELGHIPCHMPQQTVHLGRKSCS